MSVTATSNVNIIQVIPPDKTVISAVIPEAGYVVVVDNVRTGPQGVGVANNGIAGQFLISNGGSNTYWSNLSYSLFEDSGVIANTYGNSSTIPIISVNAKGIVTNLYTTSTISLNNFTYDSSNNTFAIENSNGQIFNATINSVNTFAITNSTSNVAVFVSNGNVGIGNSSPAAKLHVQGNSLFTDTITIGNSSVNTTVNSTSFSGLSALNEPLFANIRYVSSNDNINNTDNVIIASNTITLSLPNATGINGRKYVVKNVGNGVITVVGSSGQLIDGYPNLIITGAYSALTLLSNNSGWYIY